MDVISSTSTARKGCNPVLATQRSKMQSQRTLVNQKLSKQMRLRAGAENLFNATSNAKVKETVALELSFLNSNLQLLKEELCDINSTVDPYQSKSGKAVSIPMIPLGLKDTKELEFSAVFEEFLSEHYSEDPNDFCEEISDLADLRNATRTPARTADGVALLLEYYNQLYFLENRFFPPRSDSSQQPASSVYFHWYDSITGVPSLQRAVSLEKASVLFNVGALYSQLATRADRTRKAGIQSAIDSFQRAAGAFHYVRMNFSNAPTHDLTHHFLAALVDLMLAQAQECALELRVLGGFEVELGKCASVAQEAMKVSDKYTLADRGFSCEAVRDYVPYSWINMTQVKALHYRALAHYYAAVGLLQQSVRAEPDEISKLLSTLYKKGSNEMPSPGDVARRKEDRCRLGKSHSRQAIVYHERALQTHSLCKMIRTIDILKEYLQHAHDRSLDKFAEIDDEDDFFQLVEAPEIHPCTEMDTQPIPPAFKDAAIVDIFRRLGPLSVFSARNRLSAPRKVRLDDASGQFALHGDSPVFVGSVDDNAKVAGLVSDDVVVAVDGVDVRWKDHNHVADLISRRRRNGGVDLKLITVLGAVSISPTTGVCQLNDSGLGTSLYEGEVIQHTQHNNSNSNNNNNNHHPRKHFPDKRHSSTFGSFLLPKLKLRSIATVAAPRNHVTGAKKAASGADKRVIARHSSTSRSFLGIGGGSIFRKKKDLSPDHHPPMMMMKKTRSAML